MPEPMLDELGRLAPTVDVSASRELLERSRGPARPRWVLPAAVAVLLVVGVVGVWAIALRESQDELRPADNTAQPAGSLSFEVLAVDETGWAAGTVLTADDQTSYDEHWATLGLAGEQPAVDFGRSVVAVFTVPGNSCPAQLERFDVDRAVWTPVFVESGEACADIGLHWAHVVLVDRGAGDGEITFRNPYDVEGFEELDLSPPATGDEFTVFAVEGSSLEFGTMHAADSADEFAALWSDLDPGFEAPAIDFARWVALLVTMPDNACPDALVRFEVQGTFWWMPVFEVETTDCEGPLLAWTYVVGIERAALGPAVGFDLPANDAYGVSAREIQLEVTPATGPPADAPTPVQTSPPVDGPAVEAAPWRELAFVGVDLERLLPAWAVDDEQYAEVVSSLWITDPPDVDFENEIVVIFPIAHNSCTPSLVTINRDTDVWHARFMRSVADSCDDIGLASASVVAVDRQVLGDTMTIATQQIPAGPPFGTTTFRVDDGQPIDGTTPLPAEGIEVLIEGVERACALGDGSAVQIVLLAASPTAVNVEVLDQGEVVGRMYAELPDDGPTSVLVPVQYSHTPSIEGEVVVRTADHGAEVIARVAVDHTELPDGFVCG